VKKPPPPATSSRRRARASPKRRQPLPREQVVTIAIVAGAALVVALVVVLAVLARRSDEPAPAPAPSASASASPLPSPSSDATEPRWFGVWEQRIAAAEWVSVGRHATSDATGHDAELVLDLRRGPREAVVILWDTATPEASTARAEAEKRVTGTAVHRNGTRGAAVRVAGGGIAESQRLLDAIDRPTKPRPDAAPH
jgi:hypothetical protein